MVLVDAGTSRDGREVRYMTADIPVHGVLLTHSHFDHWAGAHLVEAPMFVSRNEVVRLTGREAHQGALPFLALVAVALALWALYRFAGLGIEAQLVFLVVFTVAGVPACGGLERRYGQDPKQATADEAAGQALAQQHRNQWGDRCDLPRGRAERSGPDSVSVLRR